MFFESHPLRYSLTPYQVFTIWNVFYHPYLHIYPPTQNTVPHIYIAEESIYIISPNVFIPRINPGLKSAWEIGPPTGLEGCRFVDLRRGTL